MASGSYFLILKETNNILSKEELDKLNDLNAEQDCWSNTDTNRIDCLQNTQPIRVSEDEPVTSYYSVSTGRIYDIVCEFNFLSDFLCLKEHFEMNPWTKSGEITFSTFDIYKMLEILLYIIFLVGFPAVRTRLLYMIVPLVGILMAGSMCIFITGKLEQKNFSKET